MNNMGFREIRDLGPQGVKQLNDTLRALWKIALENRANNGGTRGAGNANVAGGARSGVTGESIGTSEREGGAI